MFSRITAAYRLLDGFRRLLVNLLFFLALVLVVAVCWMAAQVPDLPKGTLLRINLVGEVKESGPVEPPFMLSMLGHGSLEENTRLSDVVEALDRAAGDERIAGVVLRVDDLSGAGMASIREIGAAVDRYRQESGRQVWTWSTSYTQPQYLIAAHSDHVGIHPMGDAVIKGLSSTTLYWGPLLRAAGLEVEVHKAGAFKSAPEIFTSGKPSAESLAAQKSYMDDAWAGLVTRLEARRGLVNGTVEKFIARLSKDGIADKPLSALFQEAGLIDELEWFKDEKVEHFSPKMEHPPEAHGSGLCSPRCWLPTKEGVALVSPEGEPKPPPLFRLQLGPGLLLLLKVETNLSYSARTVQAGMPMTVNVRRDPHRLSPVRVSCVRVNPTSYIA